MYVFCSFCTFSCVICGSHNSVEYYNITLKWDKSYVVPGTRILVGLGYISPFSAHVSSCSQPFPAAFPDHIPACVPDRFPLMLPTMLPTDFPTNFPTTLPTAFPTCPDPLPDPVPSCVLPSHPVNQMASRLPVPFLSRGKQTGTFSRTVPREGQKKNQLRRAKRRVSLRENVKSRTKNAVGLCIVLRVLINKSWS